MLGYLGYLRLSRMRLRGSGSDESSIISQDFLVDGSVSPYECRRNGKITFREHFEHLTRYQNGVSLFVFNGDFPACSTGCGASGLTVETIGVTVEMSHGADLSPLSGLA